MADPTKFDGRVVKESRRFPVELAEARRIQLGAYSAGTVVPSDLHPIEIALAPAMLRADEGDLAGAADEVHRLLQEAGDAVVEAPAAFIPSLAALLMVQDYGSAGELLTRRHGSGTRIEIVIEEPGPGRHLVRWEVIDSTQTRFVFDPAVLSVEDTRMTMLQFEWLMPLLMDYLYGDAVEAGATIINLWDAALAPGLAFCSNRPDSALIPDNLYVSTQGYAHVRRQYEASPVAWMDRAPVALWRGSTTGQITDHSGGWRSLPRIKLCEISRDFPEFVDAGITLVAQIEDPSASGWLKSEGLLCDYMAPAEFIRYRYQIDIDGNTNSWPGLFYKLLSGSPVLKVASPQGYRQWYYDRLEPWVNFVPVQADMDDLVEKVRWLHQHDDEAQAIGLRGLDLAQSLDYPGELIRARSTISHSIRF